MDNEKTPPTEHAVESVISEKQEHIAEIAQRRLEKLTARREAYQRIIDVSKKGMESYYRRHPERAMDARSQDAEDATLQGLRDIFNVLDSYVISYRTERGIHEHSAATAESRDPAEQAGEHS